MSEIIFPIFVIEGEDIAIFPSLRDLQIQLEPIDIKNNVYISYDAKGRLLKIETDGKHITVLTTEKKPMHVSDLEISLRKYLIAMKEPMAKEIACDLPCMVNLSVKYAYKSHSLRENIINLWHKLLSKIKNIHNI